MATEYSDYLRAQAREIYFQSERRVREAKSMDDDSCFAQIPSLESDQPVSIVAVVHEGMRFTIREYRDNDLQYQVSMRLPFPSYHNPGKVGYHPTLTGVFLPSSRGFEVAVGSSANYVQGSEESIKEVPNFDTILFSSKVRQQFPLTRPPFTYPMYPGWELVLPVLVKGYTDQTLETRIIDRFLEGCAGGEIAELNHQDFPLYSPKRNEYPPAPGYMIM